MSRGRFVAGLVFSFDTRGLRITFDLLELQLASGTSGTVVGGWSLAIVTVR